jgi:hypothetical protein
MTPLSLSPECRLVFLSAGASCTAATVQEYVRAGLNWQRVLVITERERAVSGLWHVIERTSGADIPVDVMAHLRRSGRVSDFRMMYLGQRLRETLAQLRDAGIPVVLLKGAALAASVYPSFAERPMADADLLVRAGDIARARDVVRAAGWRESGDPVLSRLLEGHHHLPAFVDAGGTEIRLELHTALVPGESPFLLPTEEYWAAARPARDEFAGALVPAPAYLLLHACIHFAWSHTFDFGAWRTFRDVGELIATSRIDWDQFVDLARRSRAASACYWTLRLASRLSGAPVPDAVLARLRPPSPEALRRAIERHLVAGIALGEAPRCPSVTLSRVLWRMAIRPGWSGHGRASRFGKNANWELELHGVAPDPPSGRLLRHLGATRDWWRFVTRTLLAT